MNRENKVSNCGTCKHWGNPNRDDPEGFRKCEGIVDGADYRNVLDDTPAYTEDGSGYLSSIKTKENFGCVLWEPKQWPSAST